MSEMKLPSGGKGTAGRPTKKALDERAEGLNMREGELEDREAALERRAQELEAMAAEIQKGTRTSTDEAVPRDEHRDDNPKAIRKSTNPMASGKTFPDPRPYLEAHPGKKLMWINDLNGDVQRWIDAGAEPVPVINASKRTFEGITDKTESKWVRVVGGSHGNDPFYVYLLMMDADEYDRVKLEPIRQRQAAIRESMKRGRTEQGEQGMPTYAPQLPSGNTGLEENREIAGQP